MSENFDFLKEKLRKGQPLEAQLPSILSTLKRIVQQREITLNPDRELLENISAYVKENQRDVITQILFPAFYGPLLRGGKGRLSTLLAVLSYKNADFYEAVSSALDSPSYYAVRKEDVEIWRSVVREKDDSSLQDSMEKSVWRKMLPFVPSTASVSEERISKLNGQLSPKDQERNLVQALAQEVCEDARKDQVSFEKVTRFLFGVSPRGSVKVAMFSWLLAALPQAAALLVEKRLPKRLISALPDLVPDPPTALSIASPAVTM